VCVDRYLGGRLFFIGLRGERRCHFSSTTESWARGVDFTASP
jgi:hypothetical protein